MGSSTRRASSRRRRMRLKSHAHAGRTPGSSFSRVTRTGWRNAGGAEANDSRKMESQRVLIEEVRASVRATGLDDGLMMSRP